MELVLNELGYELGYELGGAVFFSRACKKSPPTSSSLSDGGSSRLIWRSPERFLAKGMRWSVGRFDIVLSTWCPNDRMQSLQTEWDLLSTKP